MSGFYDNEAKNLDKQRIERRAHDYVLRRYFLATI